MNLTQRMRAGCLVVKLQEDRLDHTLSNEFREEVMTLARAHGGTVVIDLSEVRFMDSSGLGAVVGLRKRLGWNVRIVLAGVKSPVARVFQLSRMTEVFSFYTSADAAVGVAEGADAAR